MARKRNPEYIYKESGSRSKPYIYKKCEGCGEVKLIRVTGKNCSRPCAIRKMHADGLSRQASGPEHYRWKGSDAGYQAMHHRIVTARGRARHCELRASAGCSSITYEWAHIHGTDRGDPQNYWSLCKSCHIKYDNQRGGGNVRARLSDEQAAEIRGIYAARHLKQNALAGLYGVSPSTISKIVRGISYQEAL
jgi:hypothetical protein